MKTKNITFVPADVPHTKHDLFIKNYTTLTHNTDRIFLFSCDQKIEHLNTDFYGSNIHPNALHPEHIFAIAHHGHIGALVTHFGLITRYAHHYNTIAYIIKVNGTTNLIPTEQNDPMSKILWNISDIVQLQKETNLIIAGIGITIYLGSEYEPDMLAQAAQTIYHAHQEGFVAVVMAYCRGKSLEKKDYNELIAGATGVAHSLGADFIKIKAPQHSNTSALTRATAAAGNSKVLCAGGPHIDTLEFLETVYTQLTTCHTAGVAIGRNIFQKSLKEAVALTNAISRMVYHNDTVQDSFAHYQQMMQKTE